MFTPVLGRYIKGVEYALMTSLLQDFRRQLEHENGGHIHELDKVNAAEMLSDLCVFLGLSDQNRRKGARRTRRNAHRSNTRGASDTDNQALGGDYGHG